MALSDRDNVETNIQWNYWPAVRLMPVRCATFVFRGWQPFAEFRPAGGQERQRGLSVEDIIPYLEVISPRYSSLL